MSLSDLYELYREVVLSISLAALTAHLDLWVLLLHLLAQIGNHGRWNFKHPTLFTANSSHRSIWVVEPVHWEAYVGNSNAPHVFIVVTTSRFLAFVRLSYHTCSVTNPMIIYAWAFWIFCQCKDYQRCKTELITITHGLTHCILLAYGANIDTVFIKRYGVGVHQPVSRDEGESAMVSFCLNVTNLYLLHQFTSTRSTVGVDMNMSTEYLRNSDALRHRLN